MANQNNANSFQVQRFLQGVDYPVSKQEIIDRATEEGADQNVLNTLKNMKGDQFDSPTAVSQALGGNNNGRSDRRGEQDDDSRGGMSDDEGSMDEDMEDDEL